MLAGSFIETGFAGRSLARAGDVLLHATFDCHADAPHTKRGIQILRLPWLDDTIEGHFRVRDPDYLVRVSERDPWEAMAALATELLPLSDDDQHWTQAIASTLVSASSLSLRELAAERGLRPDELARGFRREFGVSPKRFRLEARTRRAWAAVVRTDRTLTHIAQDYDFADLAHMSRSIRAFTSRAPSAWRKEPRGRAPGQLRSS